MCPKGLTLQSYCEDGIGTINLTYSRRGLDSQGIYFFGNHSNVCVMLPPQRSFETAVCQETCHPREKKSRITQKQSLHI